MHLTQITALVASAASVAQALDNKITFKSLDDVDRTIYFTSNPGLTSPSPVDVPAGETVVVPLSDFWVGNFYAIHSGKPNLPGMLGEVAFDAWAGMHFFDVSGIVNMDDVDNVSEMWGASESVAPWTPPVDKSKYSGCTDFADCTNFYVHPDDIMTRSTTDSHMITTLGKNGVSYVTDDDDNSSGPSNNTSASTKKLRRGGRDVPGVARSLVLGKH